MYLMNNPPTLSSKTSSPAFTWPAVADVKIGAYTWPPSSAVGYLSKCIKKDLETTFARIGFRISGLQVSLAGGDGDGQVLKPGREAMKRLATAEDEDLVLRKFVSSNAAAGDGQVPDCVFASVVFGGSDGILAQLLELKAWFEVQTRYHFYSSSMLLMYDLEEEGCVARASTGRVKMVDFAHVEEGQGVIDHNFLGGLCSLIKFLNDIPGRDEDVLNGSLKPK